MSTATTQSDFRKHIKEYLNQVNEYDQTVLVACSNQFTVAIISQDQLNALIDAVNAREDSLDYAIARDKLIDIQVLPDDPIVKSNDNYWNKFKENRDNKHI